LDAMDHQREFAFTPKDFDFIRQLVAAQTGIALSESKSDMVYSRLSRRLRKLQINSFASYCELLRDNDSGELSHFVNAITTNLTSFFRERHHFEFLTAKLLPQILAGKTQRRVRIWSAGCSTGEEPYSIAITIKQAMPDLRGWDVKILATDLDSNVVDKAASGVYDKNRLNGLSSPILKKYFLKTANENQVRIAPEIQELITFKQLNLMHQWPMKGPFDFIFCRNVVIYFNKETQKSLFNRYADITVESGHLFIGHSESLFKVCDRYKLIGNTIYQKIR
jgi:chemotaxis protein methyltransferase CheR